jgi:hypothetical protein
MMKNSRWFVHRSCIHCACAHVTLACMCMLPRCVRAIYSHSMHIVIRVKHSLASMIIFVFSCEARVLYAARTTGCAAAAHIVLVGGAHAKASIFPRRRAKNLVRIACMLCSGWQPLDECSDTGTLLKIKTENTLVMCCVFNLVIRKCQGHSRHTPSGSVLEVV